jgi:DNA-binding transcriptional LysR family regulator
MTRDHLYEFLVLSQTLNYSKAAKLLFISQASLSRHIDQLEEELGCQLLTRSTHSVALTPAGNLFRSDAAHLVEKYDDALKRLQLDSVSTFGSCSILCSNAALSPHLSQFFHTFQKKYAGIQLSIEIEEDSKIPELIRKYDLTFSIFKGLDEPDIISHEIFEHDSCLMLPMDKSFKNPYMLSLGELSGETVLMPYSNTENSPFYSIRKMIERKNFGRADIIDVPNIETALFQVNLGYGVAILPKHMETRIQNETRIMNITDSECTFPIILYNNVIRQTEAVSLILHELLYSSAIYMDF